ncbi:hypothetical protein [Paenibacillus xylanexedens]|uniref:hypothetical protein n=1 Tax=Paenibacillus xylanexedens TaxID=528191 RepID=UPI0011A670EC|nr:hypothetical protein [Paenibacillus xylanexedens]
MINNVIKALIIGSANNTERAEALQPNEGVAWIIYEQDDGAPLTSAELFLGMQSMVGQVNFVILDTRFGEPTFDMGVILQMAYSKQIPVFTVSPGWNELYGATYLDHVSANTFKTFAEAVNHLKDQYI